LSFRHWPKGDKQSDSNNEDGCRSSEPRPCLQYYIPRQVIEHCSLLPNLIALYRDGQQSSIAPTE
jgi:hypothetical protein